MPHLTPGLDADETAQLNSLVTEMRSLVLDLSHVVKHARVIDDAMQAYGNSLLAAVQGDAAGISQSDATHWAAVSG